MRVVSWNVNGIRAVERKDELPWKHFADADVICLQETKAHHEQVNPATVTPPGWHSWWHSADKRGYSGTAIYAKSEPDEIILGIGDDEFDCEGRVISALYDDLLITSAYFPNAQEAGKRIAYKLAFCARMEDFLREWTDQGVKTCLMGDYNIAHETIDLARPNDNHGNPGFLPQEREWMSRYLGLGYHDVFREMNPDLEGAYTWWTYRGGARTRNVGWRIDYATVDPALRSAVRETAIHPKVMGSDHCPVSIDLDI